MGLFDKVFKPQWMSEVDHLAVEAVKEVDDPETLRRIVSEARSPEARLVAMEKLDDQTLYREVALSSDDRKLVGRAVEHVDDIEVLARVKQRGVAYPSDIAKRVKELRHAEFAALLEKIPAMDDVSRLVEISSTDPLKDEFKPYASNRGYDSYKPPRTIEDDLREAAIARLAALESDTGLGEVVNRSTSRPIVELAASKIRDTGLFEQLIRERCFTSSFSAELVIARIENIALLRELASEVDPTEIVPKAAMRRLCELPCEAGQDHDWELIREEKDDPFADHRSIDSEYRCTRCGINRLTRTELG